jgi:F-type H+-transporting ATPase subunit a
MLKLRDLTPDVVVFWHWGAVSINATLVFTWIVMAVLILLSWAITARLGRTSEPGRWEMFLEMAVETIREQVREVVKEDPDAYLPFIGTLVLFIGTANLLMIVPGFVSPTASLSTTAALAGCVFFAVPLYAVFRQGMLGYLKHYVSPSVFMLPFHVISELSRTLAMAVRLFGNVMSSGKIAALILAVSPLLFPVVMQALGLLTGLIQAYIFAVLALIYIASAERAQKAAPQQKAEGTT